MVETLIMSPKLAALGLFKTKIFLNEGYHVIFSAHNIPTKFYHENQIML